MKTKKIIRRMDDALFQLQEAQAMLEAVQTGQGARAIAEMMQAPLDEMLNILEHLMDKMEKAA